MAGAGQAEAEGNNQKAFLSRQSDGLVGNQKKVVCYRRNRHLAGIRRQRIGNRMENQQINNPKIVFMGTPEFGALILEKLIEGGYKPVLVVTVPDKPSGRKQQLTPPAVKITALKHGIETIQPEKLKDAKEKIKSFQPDLIITAAYSKILPDEIIGLPEKGCINVHPSLLPKHRGPSPVQQTILDGDKKTGVTIMLMDSQIDHGPILAQEETEIKQGETASELHGRLAEIGGKLLLKIIPEWMAGTIKAVSQDDEAATYTKIIKREDGKIDWQNPPEKIERKIRAFSPWPGAYTFWNKNGKTSRLKILKARMEDGKLTLEEVQPEGKKPMGFGEFLRGNPEFARNKEICSRIQI